MKSPKRNRKATGTTRKRISKIRAVTTETFGERLRRLRKSRGLSQEQLAAKAGMVREQIARYETGARKSPLAPAMRRLADALDVSVSELVGAVTLETSQAVDEYLRSDWAKAARPTAEEIEWLRSLPDIVMRGVDSSPVAIQALLQWRRNNPGTR